LLTTLLTASNPPQPRAGRVNPAEGMNKAAQQLGRLGGLARSEAKAAANRAKAAQFWEDVRAGKAPAPRSRKKCAKRSPNYMMKDEAKKRGAMAEYDYDRAKSKSEKGARPSLMVDGAKAGTLV
jgi:hypothetical protein